MGGGLSFAAINRMSMNVLVIGSGGREHALVYKIAASPLVEAVYVTPGNPGTSGIARNRPLPQLDGPSVGALVQAEGIDLVVVGPEGPLADGLADALRAQGIPVVGPGKAGAILESSKAWSKEFMARHHIPTAAYRSFESAELDAALAYVGAHSLPIVVKASGLAAGKGVVICASHAEAQASVREMLSGEAFGAAGAEVVIEEFLTGIEVSVFVLTDGKRAVLLPEAKDYKRIGEGDTGPNTGGMGAVSPAPFADQAFMAQVQERIIAPTISGLAAEGIDYRGFIFFGLISVGGAPYVIEYNARMGDPETEAVVPRIDGDLVPVLAACAAGDLSGQTLGVLPDHAVTVVLVSGGYPGSFPKGLPVTVGDWPGALYFHAGTADSEQGLVTAGGRVMAVTALGQDLATARELAYAQAEEVAFQGRYFRRDIGLDLLPPGA
jgi:phosphoribosylamine---glycine ligase